jgi:hypothetical protein
VVAVPGEPGQARVRPDRARPFAATGDRRVGRLGRPPPGTGGAFDGALVDAATGEEAEPVVVDARTGLSVDDSEAVVFAAGPSAGPQMRARFAEPGRSQAQG